MCSSGLVKEREPIAFLLEHVHQRNMCVVLEHLQYLLERHCQHTYKACHVAAVLANV
jgi:hypothetical protein